MVSTSCRGWEFLREPKFLVKMEGAFCRRGCEFCNSYSPIAEIGLFVREIAQVRRFTMQGTQSKDNHFFV